VIISAPILRTVPVEQPLWINPCQLDECQQYMSRDHDAGLIVGPCLGRNSQPTSHLRYSLFTEEIDAHLS